MTTARARTSGILALLGVQLCFGLFPLFVHWAEDPAHGFAPRAIVFWRIASGALVLGALAVLVHGWRVRPPRADLPRLCLCAVLGVALNMPLALEGMGRTSVIHAGLLVTLIPIFTYASAWIAGQERWAARRAAGIAVGCAGAALLVVVRSSGAAPLGASPSGPILMAASCCSYAVYLVLLRTLLARHPALVVVAWVFALALLALPVLALGVPLWPEAPSPRALAGLAYSVSFPTVLAFLLNGIALARVPASTTAAFIYLQPAVAATAAVLFAGERLAPVHWAAGGLSFLGVWLVAGRGAAPGGAEAGTSPSIQSRAGRVFHSRR